MSTVQPRLLIARGVAVFIKPHPSAFLKGKMATTNASQKLSRDDWKKRKELEEARKAGTAPAEVDELGRLATSYIASTD